mmetsp:Transcript_8615/g.24302  ORF Transcript_8615/g.24302 Transcript_8615/m.24302 type:complete len:121 (+) Transcript_8615:79-441(+)
MIGMMKVLALATMVVAVSCIGNYTSLNFYTSEEGCSGNGTSIKTGECTTVELVNCGETYSSLFVAQEGAYVELFHEVKCEGMGFNWGTYCKEANPCSETECIGPLQLDGVSYLYADCTAA